MCSPFISSRVHEPCVCLILLLAGCSVEASVGGGIDGDRVTEGIIGIADEQIPDGAPWDADCGDTDFSGAEDGDTFDCVAIANDGTELPAVVTVEDAEEGDADIQIN